MDELAKRMMELAEKVGPDAMSAARGAAQVEAYSAMASGALLVALALAFAAAGRYLWISESEYSSFDGERRFFGGALVTIGVVTLAIAAWQFMDPWTWTAINNPDLWLAKKVLRL